MGRYLLDTHVVLWWAEGDAKLSPKHIELLRDETNEIYLSVVSAWEVSIKASQGKLHISQEPLPYFQQIANRCQFTVLPVQLSHAAGVYRLPKVHNDPFDRLLISQARSENLTVLSDDALFTKYDLPGLISG